MYAEVFRKHEVAERGYIMVEKRLFDLKIGDGQQLLLALQNSGFTAKQARRLIDDPLFAKEFVARFSEEKTDRFALYKRFLFPIEKQAPDLREKNRQMPTEFQIPDSEFDDVGTNSDHDQAYENLEFLFISLGDFQKTQKLIRLQTMMTHGVWLADLSCEHENTFKLHKTAADYFYKKAGIYRLRIDLAANWEPVAGYSADQIWKKCIKSGKKTNVGSLGNAALNVQDPKLRSLQDGIHLPYHYHTDIIIPGDGYSSTPCSGWVDDFSQVRFNLVNSDSVDRHHSAPSLVE